MLYYNKIVLQTLSHRQDLICTFMDLHTFLDILGRNKHFSSAPRQQISKNFFILWLLGHDRLLTTTRQTFSASTPTQKPSHDLQRYSFLSFCLDCAQQARSGRYIGKRACVFHEITLLRFFFITITRKSSAQTRFEEKLHFHTCAFKTSHFFKLSFFDKNVRHFLAHTQNNFKISLTYLHRWTPKILHYLCKTPQPLTFNLRCNRKHTCTINFSGPALRKQ